jgi:hypothetical protein
MKSKLPSTESKSMLATRAIHSLILALRRHGVSKAEIQRIIHRVDIDGRRPAIPGIACKQDSALIGTALALWYRDVRFLGDAGFPLALRASGRAPSIQSLLIASGVELSPPRVIEMMQRAGVLKRTRGGRFLPVSRSAKMPELNAFLVEHLAQGILKLVQTVSHNYSSRGRNVPIFEQSATVRNLPRTYRKAYREFVNTQGAAFVTNIDDWLEARALRVRRGGTRQKKPKNAVPAGVYAFAFLQ